MAAKEFDGNYTVKIAIARSLTRPREQLAQVRSGFAPRRNLALPERSPQRRAAPRRAGEGVKYNIRSGATLFPQGDNSTGPIRTKIIFDTGIYGCESENHTGEQKEGVVSAIRETRLNQLCETVDVMGRKMRRETVWSRVARGRRGMFPSRGLFTIQRTRTCHGDSR